ncbi:MAG: hypothetical protein ACRDVE_15665 [Actinocrinis sp.]
MSIERLFVRSVTVLDGVDVPTGYGNATRLDWSNPTPRITKGWLGPYSGESENALDRDQQMADATLYLPADDPITALSRVQIDGVTYQVTGPPSPPFTPRGPHHVEVDLKIVKG